MTSHTCDITHSCTLRRPRKLLHIAEASKAAAHCGGLESGAAAVCDAHGLEGGRTRARAVVHAAGRLRSAARERNETESTVERSSSREEHLRPSTCRAPRGSGRWRVKLLARSHDAGREETVVEGPRVCSRNSHCFDPARSHASDTGRPPLGTWTSVTGSAAATAWTNAADAASHQPRDQARAEARAEPRSKPAPKPNPAETRAEARAETRAEARARAEAEPRRSPHRSPHRSPRRSPR